MRVFTTIYLAETLNADVDSVEDAEDFGQQTPWTVGFKPTLRQGIPMHENPDSYETGDFDR